MFNFLYSSSYLIEQQQQQQKLSHLHISLYKEENQEGIKLLAKNFIRSTPSKL